MWLGNRFPGQTTDISWSNTLQQTQCEVPGTRQIARSTCPCSQELILTQDPPGSFPSELHISQGHLTRRVKQMPDLEAHPGTPYKPLYRLWKAMTTDAMQSSHIKHQAVTNVLNERRNDPAHKSSTLRHKWGFQRLGWGPSVVSPLWSKQPLTSAIHLLVTCRACELGLRREVPKWKVDR